MNDPMTIGRLYGRRAGHKLRVAQAELVEDLLPQLAVPEGPLDARVLSKDDQPHAHIIADCLLAAMVASALGAAVLIAFPQFMFPNSSTNGFDRFLPLAIFAIVATDVALSALAYKFDILSTVRARAVVEPWTISIAAGILYFYSARDGLILAYVASLAAASV
jgi:hypothetical protein